MQYILKSYFYATTLMLSAVGLLCCNPTADNSKDAPDNSLTVIDSTRDASEPDSTTRTFDMILDSIYHDEPKQVFQALIAGHSRYFNDTSFVYHSEIKIPDDLARIKPFLVLTDVDLDQSVEKIFDMRRSMFIQLSSPACLVAPQQVGVMEYALHYCGTKVILVLSSSSSRIIGAAVDNVQTTNFSSILSELSQASKTAAEFADRSSANKGFVNSIAQGQARLSLEKILQMSPQVKMLTDSGRIIIKSAFYDADKHSVTILDREAPINPSAKQ